MRRSPGSISGWSSGPLGRGWASALQKLRSSDLLRGILETFASRVLLMGVGFCSSVVIARILGPEGRGVYAAAMIIGALGVQLGNLGLHASNIYFVAKDRAVLHRLVGNALAVAVVVGGASAVAALLAFRLWPQVAPVSGLLLGLSLLWIPFGLCSLLCQHLLLGIQQVRAYNVIEVGQGALVLAAVAVLAAAGAASPETVFLAGLASVAGAAAASLLLLHRHAEQEPRPSLRILGRHLGYGARAYAAALFAFLVLRIDLLMVKHLAGDAAAGHYSVAATLADVVNTVPVVVGTLLFPRLSSLADAAEKWRLARAAAGNTAVVMAGVAAVAAACSGPAVRLLFGEAFGPSAAAFVILLPGIFFLGIQVVAVQFLNSLGFPAGIAVIWACACFLNIGLNFWMIPAYGINGASFASSVSYGSVFFAVAYMISRRVRAGSAA